MATPTEQEQATATTLVKSWVEYDERPMEDRDDEGVQALIAWIAAALAAHAAEVLTTERARMRDRLVEIEWKAEGGHWEEAACPACGRGEILSDVDRRMPHYYGHAADCWLADAIRTWTHA